MNVTPVQNNSQSFGMAFKLKGDGAKKLATFLEETNTATNKYVMDELIPSIHSLKTNVIYDGQDVMVAGKKVSDKVPVAMPGTDYKDLQYLLDNEVYHVKYALPKNKLIDVYTGHPLTQTLFNAKEIAKDMDVKAATQTYEAQVTAGKQTRIEESAKKLQDLYG